MSRWLLRNHLSLFIGINVALDLALLIMAPVHGASAGEVLYVGVLFGLCSAPLVPMESFNGRYSLLLIFMFTYFMHFGGVDAQLILLGQNLGPAAGPDAGFVRTSFMLPAEMLVLACGALLLLGYRGLARARPAAAPVVAPAEWPEGTMLVAGLALWIVGTMADIYLGVFVVPESTTRAVAKGFSGLGTIGTFALMLGRLMQPLGLLILAYGYARFRGWFWTTLIIAIQVAQVAAGFVTDVKTTAMMGVVVVVVTRLLVDNRPPVAWIASAALGIALIFPVFQANRMEVTGERGLNHLQAFQNIGKVFQISLDARDKVESSNLVERPPTFVERVYVKNNLEQVVEHVGNDVAYLHGASLKEVALAFVPRLIIGDKQSISMGQLFTHQIAHSDTDTFISISHIGELYWNFGWIGTLLGLLVTGMILGTVGSWSSLEGGPSLTHVMVLMVTVQNLCLGFEGEISISYVVWMRCLAAIGLLHLLFARRSTAPAVPGQAPSRAVAGTASLPALPAPFSVRFPNVMR